MCLTAVSEHRQMNGAWLHATVFTLTSLFSSHSNTFYNILTHLPQGIDTTLLWSSKDVAVLQASSRYIVHVALCLLPY